MAVSQQDIELWENKIGDACLHLSSELLDLYNPYQRDMDSHAVCVCRLTWPNAYDHDDSNPGGSAACFPKAGVSAGVSKLGSSTDRTYLKVSMGTRGAIEQNTESGHRIYDQFELVTIFQCKHSPVLWDMILKSEFKLLMLILLNWSALKLMFIIIS